MLSLVNKATSVVINPSAYYSKHAEVLDYADNAHNAEVAHSKDNVAEDKGETGTKRLISLQIQMMKLRANFGSLASNLKHLYGKRFSILTQC